MANAFGLSESTADTLQWTVDTVRGLDRLPKPEKPALEARGPGSAWIKVTGPIDDGRYPGIWMYRTVLGQEFAGDEVWLEGINGETFEADDIVRAWVIGADEDDGLPVFQTAHQPRTITGITVQEADGSPSYTSVPTLIVTQSTGIYLSAGSNGVSATISAQAADTLNWGVVSTATQTFSGIKRFQGSGTTIDKTIIDGDTLQLGDPTADTLGGYIKFGATTGGVQADHFYATAWVTDVPNPGFSIRVNTDDTINYPSLVNPLIYMWAAANYPDAKGSLVISTGHGSGPPGIVLIDHSAAVVRTGITSVLPLINLSFHGGICYGAGSISTSGTGNTIVVQTGPTITNAAINQAANGNTALTQTRFTDTAPTGNFQDLKSAAGASLWTVDITGKLIKGAIDCGTF